jgi:hypothetical protein
MFLAWFTTFLCLVVPLAADAVAQERRPLAPADADTVDPPEGPEVIARSASRTHAIIRATKLPEPIRIDGRLDESFYESVRSIGDFIQMEPVEGQPATEQSEVWIFYDRDNVYVSARLWDSHPEREVVDEMRRDNNRVVFNENFAFSFDTFHDRRSGYDFEVNPLGGRWDGQFADDGGVINSSVNPVWEYKTGRFDHGWTVEARVPFKSLRIGSRTQQEWGFQARRWVRWKNEMSFITRINAAIGSLAVMKVSLSPTLIGLEAPPADKHLELKPYATASVASDTTVAPQISNKGSGGWGGDVKYGVSRTLTLDGTYNTDFAQVEADLQQVNLTRFNLFFPEQRDFFLENFGAFTFGGTSSAASSVDNTPLLFYSRRIGLSGSSAVPIVAGGRLSGRAGRFSIGVLHIVTDEKPEIGARQTGFSVIRLKRDLFRRSSVGMIFTNRTIGQVLPGANRAYGVDGQFLVTNTIVVNTYWAKTDAPGRSGEDISHKARFDYEGDRYGLLAEYLAVGANFSPDIGFVRHPDLHRSYLQGRFSPRPRRNRFVRKLYYNGTFEYIQNGAGRLDTRTGTAEFAIDFHNADHFNVKAFSTYEFLPAPLTLAPGVAVASGGYDYGSVLLGYNLGPSRRRVLANLSIEQGTLYGGNKTIATVSGALISFPPHLVVEPTYSLSAVSVPQGSFATHLLGPRVTFMATPLMFIAALVQYNSTANTVSSNVRFRWEYQPGSELFVVWNDQRSTAAPAGLPSLQNRAFIVKLNRLLRF